MKHRLLYIPIAFLFILSFTDCAKRGRPTGGLKDSIPPVIIKSSPENYSIHFNENEIKIYFDEYVKLKDLNKELIISPPFKNQPNITPLSTSKFIKIKFTDTLKENTTYSFNFGKSIVDNNEENAFKYFKYIFSTGSFIDSLSLRGNINDALLLKRESATTVMLYEVNEAFKDSIVYLEKPTYITSTQDSTDIFELSNLKKGDYLLVALEENNNDYMFQPQNDKIGFANTIITIPTDSAYTINLFKETPEYSLTKPKHESKNHIIFGYQGDAKNLELELASEVSKDFEAISYKDRETDSIHYWFKPSIENDSLLFYAKNGLWLDTLNTRMRDLHQDSLKISAIKSGILTLNDTLSITANTPIVSLNLEKITIMDKDSLDITVNGIMDKEYNTTDIIFSMTEGQNYTIQFLPGAFTDFYENTNDTLVTRVRTKALSDYGTLALTLSNAKDFPYIIQLVTERFKVISEEYLSTDQEAFFDFITPGKYYIRIIYDENENKIWDTGNYLKGLQPEKVIYYPSLLEVRANWSLNETFILD